MNPIINPLWFYIAGISESVSSTFYGVAVAFIICVVFEGLYLVIESPEKKTQENIMRTMKITVIHCVTLFVLSSLIPSKETCYQMIAAQACTPDNLSAAVEVGKSISDYIVESAMKIIEATK